MLALIDKAKKKKKKKKKSLVSGYPIDPNLFGPTQTFLGPSGIFRSLLRLF